MNMNHCLAELRCHDYYRYLWAICAPAASRHDVAALLAWVMEIESIPTKVSEELIAHMRFAWWREVLDELFAGKPPRQGHPVIEALAPMIAAGKVQRETMDAVIDKTAERFGQEQIIQSTDLMESLCLQVIGQTSQPRWQKKIHLIEQTRSKRNNKPHSLRLILRLLFS